MIKTVRNTITGIVFTFLLFGLATTAYAEPVVNVFNISPEGTCSSSPCQVRVDWDVAQADVLYIDQGDNNGNSTRIVNTTSGSSFVGSMTVWALNGTNTFTIRPNNVPVNTKTTTVQSSSGGSSGSSSPTSTPVPTITPIYRQCNETCGGANQQCGAGLQCISISGQYLCRHPSVPSRGDCSTTGGNTSGTSSPTATPTPVINPSTGSGQAGGTGSVLGAATGISPSPATTDSESTVLAQQTGSTSQGQTLGIAEKKNTKSSPLSFISNGLRGLQEAIYKAVPAARSNPLVGMVVALAGLGVIGAVGFGIYQYTQDMTGDKLRKTIQKMKSDS